MNNSLLKRIEASFEKVPRPRYTTKRVARGLDDCWTLTDTEWQALYSQDTEQHWREVHDDDLIHYLDIFSFLHADGVLFYGVAHMAYALRTNDTGYCSSFILSICRNSLPSLTEEQRNCLLEFLEFYRSTTTDLDQEIAGYGIKVVAGRQLEIPFDTFVEKRSAAMLAKVRQGLNAGTLDTPTDADENPEPEQR